ncbi:GNAT family N-acetyltransferase [Sinomonas sp. JGH33]|uniref:GNAT family N-acetyltransferase n=1 Tax=Sinomonas terricola TaxID=3110330 RepID=A0ABU5TC57_9MICC|nr:GNAT family N-acetyltransferase [Sinomonas sp. JGH33]MEA5457258.1 GNAT family N-acetyltransferase [Sinomonas sp. JGH33]
MISEDWAARAAGLVRDGRLDLFVAVAGSKPVGYAAVTYDVGTWNAATYAHLDCLYVVGDYRGVGTGRRLFGAVVQHSRDLGHSELQWQTPAWNDGAIRFYRRLSPAEQAKQRFTLDLDRQ